MSRCWEGKKKWSSRSESPDPGRTLSQSHRTSGCGLPHLSYGRSTVSSLGDGQLAFDFAELEREDARGRLDEWSGAPLHFTTDFHPPAALDAAFEHWCFLNGRFDSIARSHMWHRVGGARDDVVFGNHSVAVFSAALWVERGMEGPSVSPTQSICEPCEWHHISGDESEAVEAWHDHAVPGWRELPVVPFEIRVRDDKGFTKLARKWLEVHYPPQAQFAGAPIITERTPHGTRHVPGGSPWGGYDLSSTALTAAQGEDRAETMRREAIELDYESASPVARTGRGLDS